MKHYYHLPAHHLNGLGKWTMNILIILAETNTSIMFTKYLLLPPKRLKTAQSSRHALGIKEGKLRYKIIKLFIFFVSLPPFPFLFEIKYLRGNEYREREELRMPEATFLLGIPLNAKLSVYAYTSQSPYGLLGTSSSVPLPSVSFCQWCFPYLPA